MSYIEQLFGLQNKVVVVTGGTGVLGSAMCQALARAGARVVIMGRRKEAAEELVKRIKQDGGEAMAVAADVLQEDQLRAAKELINKNYGSIDILVNGAGGNIAGAVIPPDKTFLNLDMNAFQQVMDVNVRGTVLPCQIFGEDMIANKRGVIINISSLAAILPLTRVVGYSAAKAAISNFTQWLAVEMGQKFGEGIRVNAIAPGFFLTEQNKTLLTKEDGSLTPRGETIIKSTPFGRFGKPDELCGALIWLCSDSASFTSGIVVTVDGAYSAFSGV